MAADLGNELVPVTIVAGYLGAGKTTLLNRLLADEHGRRLAVLVNDFGTINLDAALISARHGETISLQNGCICCSISDALGDSLDRVLALDPPPDQIVVEASGVAEPDKVALYGQGWPGCRLDAIITVADAETIRARATDRFVGELVSRQLRQADAVVLAKCDLVSRDQLDTVVEWVGGIVATVPVFESSGGRIDPALVLDGVEGRPRERMTSHADPALPGHTIESIVIELDEPLDPDGIEAALATWPDDILRVKGVVTLGTSPPRRYIVQRVGRRTTIEPAPDGIDPTVVDTLVVLGRRPIPHRDDLVASLRAR